MATKMTSAFTWLHLTDLHVGQDGTKARWKSIVEEKLIADLKALVARIRPLDAIFFTGDLTQQGLDTEFRELAPILARLRDAVDPHRRAVFLAVPGNHDLQRPKPNSTVVRVLTSDWKKDAKLREEFWSDPSSEYREAVGKAFQEWSRWSENALDWAGTRDLRKNGVLPGDFAATIERDELRIGVLGLNTAALQLAGGDYRGRLSVDSRQATTLVDRVGAWADSHDASILLTHHDPSWLDEDGRAALDGEIAPAGRFAVQLCGHRHEQGRTVTSHGGHRPQRLLIGRSLFGLDTYGDRKVRRHGYSVGSITLAERKRVLRVWPRWDVKQQPGHIELKADQSDDLGADEGTAPEDLGPSPRPSASEGTTAGGAHPAPEGWTLIDGNFVAAQAKALRAADLDAYFEGEDPEWPPIVSGQVPVREAGASLVEELRREREHPVSVHVVLGPGGEGKTTLVMQAAATIGADARCRVLWRMPSVFAKTNVLHWNDLRGQLRPNEALYLVIDDAHDLRASLDDFLVRDRVDREFRGAPGGTLHLVLCAHQDDWARSAPARSERWRRASSTHEVSVSGLSRADALAIVRAYRATGALGTGDDGVSDDARADTLVAAAHARSAAAEDALLGALIEVRTGNPIEVHVERILHRIAEASEATDVDVYDCFVTTAAANAVGIHRLDARVLREAIGLDEEALGKAVGIAGAELRIEGYGANRAVRVRHGAIARLSARLAFGAPPTARTFRDKAIVYKRLGWAAVDVVPEFWRSPATQPILDLSVTYRDADPAVAIAVAEGAVVGAQGDDHLRSRLAQTYREAGQGDYVAAEATCREYFVAFPKVVEHDSIRPLVREWAISAGGCKALSHHGALSTWLALWSFSDQMGGEVTPHDARHLPTITKGLELAQELLDKDMVSTAAAAIVAAGRSIPDTPSFESANKLVGANAASTGNDLAAVLPPLAALVWKFVSHDLGAYAFVPDGGRLTFRRLQHAIGPTRLRRRH